MKPKPSAAEENEQLRRAATEAIARDIRLDLALYGRYPWPIAERSAKDPRLEKP
jgi:hypothetical protein